MYNLWDPAGAGGRSWSAGGGQYGNGMTSTANNHFGYGGGVGGGGGTDERYYNRQF